MPGVVRQGDMSTGHDDCPPEPLITASDDVFVNGKGIGRVDDEYDAHGCIIHGTHNDKIIRGSTTVFANNKAVARTGDPTDWPECKADGCSADVLAGG